MINSNWTRWIIASTNSVFSERTRTDSVLNIVSDNVKGKVPIYFSDFEHDDTIRQPFRIELRVNDLSIKEGSKNFYRVRCYIDLMAVTTYDKKDSYAKARVVGLAQALHGDFDIYRYGPTVGIDTEAWLMCLRLIKQDGEHVKVTDFGEKDANTPLAHTLVSGLYEGHIGET